MLLSTKIYLDSSLERETHKLRDTAAADHRMSFAHETLSLEMEGCVYTLKDCVLFVNKMLQAPSGEGIAMA